jgi:hypothetical protein
MSTLNLEETLSEDELAVLEQIKLSEKASEESSEITEKKAAKEEEMDDGYIDSEEEEEEMEEASCDDKKMKEEEEEEEEMEEGAYKKMKKEEEDEEEMDSSEEEEEMEEGAMEDWVVTVTKGVNDIKKGESITIKARTAKEAMEKASKKWDTDMKILAGKLDAKPASNESAEEEEMKDKEMDESTVQVKDIGGLIDSDETLSEEFKEKAKVIFETAVAEKLIEKVEKIEKEYHDKLEEETQNNFNTLVEKVDEYLTTVVENWVTENEVTVSKSIKTDIAESFFDNMKQVFEKHYITVPESKVDVYEELSKKAAVLESIAQKQNAQIEDLSEKLEVLKREKILKESCEGLYQSQAHKLCKLAETIEYSDDESFARKLTIIKENFLNNGKSEDDVEVINESSNSTVVRTKLEEDDVKSEVNDIMGRYVEALNQQTKNLNSKL